MIETPTVSVNLCCYNSEQYLEETLQSIFAQTYGHWELIVVNDGSTDSTEAIIKRHMGEGHRIVYHYQANAGLAAARNKAIELSQGEFIALIDHDDLWHPEKLGRQVALFVERPQVGLVYSKAAALISGNRTGLHAIDSPMYRGRVFIPLVLGNFVPCSSIVIRRIALDQVGWFNPGFSQVEEYDLSIRIAEKYEFDYVNEPLLTFRVHPRNSSWNGFNIQSEMITLMRRVLERTPKLPCELGVNVTRIKRAGLPCKLGQAYLLHGRLRAAHRWYGGLGKLVLALPRVVPLYLLSLVPSSAVVYLISWGYRLRKWVLIGSS